MSQLNYLLCTNQSLGIEKSENKTNFVEFLIRVNETEGKLLQNVHFSNCSLLDELEKNIKKIENIQNIEKNFKESGFIENEEKIRIYEQFVVGIKNNYKPINDEMNKLKNKFVEGSVNNTNLN